MFYSNLKKWRKKMKKVVWGKLAGVMVLILIASMVLAGCGSNAGTSSGSNEETATSDSASESDTTSEKSSSDESTETSKGYKIGFSAFAMQQEWYQNIASGAKNEAESRGIQLDIVDADSNATTQLESIENFITQGVDAIIISPVEADSLAPVVKTAEEKGIKVICESNMVEGADTVVGMSHYDVAYQIGTYFAEYCKENNVEPKLLILGYEPLENCRQRVEGFKTGMDDAGLEYEVKTEIDGGFREVSLNVATDAFTANSDINCIFGINDDSTIGAVEAAKALGMDLDSIYAITYGLEGKAGRSALYEGGAYKFALASFPEAVGSSCVKAAVAAIEGEELPELYESPTAIVTHDDFEEYFIKNGDTWDINFDKLKSIEG